MNFIELNANLPQVQADAKLQELLFSIAESTVRQSAKVLDEADLFSRNPIDNDFAGQVGPLWDAILELHKHVNQIIHLITDRWSEEKRRTS
jgi:hypothetical protein